MQSLRGIAFLLGLLGGFVLPGGSVFSQAGGEDPSLRDPRLGGSRGRMRYRIARAPYEHVETPDVITLRGGIRLEAYFLEIYGSWLVFYVKETADSWLKEEVPRSEVASIEFDSYLDRDPVEPREIRRAAKQPVPKQEILSGAFTATQGRYTSWKITFKSEVSKFEDFSEDATEYGSVHIESRFHQTIGGEPRAHDVKVDGKYYLYAPGTVNNKDWVLVLSEMVGRQVDRAPTVTMLAERVPDETLILDFSRGRESFTLQWSNLGAWTWTSIVGLHFRRMPEDGGARRRILGPARDKEPRDPDKPRRSRTDWRDPRAQRTRVATGHRWRTGSWGKPTTYWNARSR